MIKIENVDVYGWETAIRGARNPMNSWDKTDSYWTHIQDAETLETANFQYFVGNNDLKLLRHLANAGPDHGKFLRMITVSLDITAPLYWWKEFDTYKVGTVANSCSTMHKIHAKEFTLDDFSHEHLGTGSRFLLRQTVDILNEAREAFISCNTSEQGGADLKKFYWWQMIQLLPSSYNQRRTVLLNYQVLKSMYHARKNHKLDEWHIFCDFIKELPYSELITGGDE
jgi:hypothetical protein